MLFSPSLFLNYILNSHYDRMSFIFYYINPVGAKKIEFERVSKNWRKFAKSSISLKAKWDDCRFIQYSKSKMIKLTAGFMCVHFWNLFWPRSLIKMTFYNKKDALMEKRREIYDMLINYSVMEMMWLYLFYL